MPAYIICLGVALALFGSSQPTGADRIPPVLARAVQPLQPPPAAGSWILQVISRGGLDGGGTGDFTLASNGEATFVWPSGAASSVSLELVKRLDQSIRGLRP